MFFPAPPDTELAVEDIDAGCVGTGGMEPAEATVPPIEKDAAGNEMGDETTPLARRCRLIEGLPGLREGLDPKNGEADPKGGETGVL